MLVETKDNISKIPNDLKQEILDYYQYISNTDYPTLYIDYVDNNCIGITTLEYYKNYGSTGSITYYETNNSITNQIKNILPKEIKNRTGEVGLLGIYGPELAPHVDNNTESLWHLNYNLISGGDNVKTNFYIPNNENKNKIIEASWVPKNRIELAESYNIPNEVWHFICTSQVHNVSNIETFFRLNLTLTYY